MHIVGNIHLSNFFLTGPSLIDCWTRRRQYGAIKQTLCRRQRTTAIDFYSSFSAMANYLPRGPNRPCTSVHDFLSRFRPRFKTAWGKWHCSFFEIFIDKQANTKKKMDSPRLGSWHHHYSRRASRSQPITPPTFRERIAVRFRRRRPWESPRRSRNSTSAELVMPRYQDGRERRRRARGSLERHSPSDIGSPGQCTPVGE